MADRGGTLKESSASGRIRPSLGGPVAASDRAIYSARFIFADGPECVSAVDWALP